MDFIGMLSRKKMFFCFCSTCLSIEIICVPIKIKIWVFCLRRLIKLLKNWVRRFKREENYNNNMKSKKGDLWVSAVLYLTLGVIAISLILGAAVPFINKIKELLFTLDETIRRVANEGPGSQRELSPFTIGAGKLSIYQDVEQINWTLETEALIQEPNIGIKEGVLTLLLEETKTEGKYNFIMSTTYTNIDLNLTSQLNNPFAGTFSVLVRHSGRFTANKPEIEIHIN